MSTATADPSIRRPRLIRNAAFVKLWSAETISQFGTQVSGLALPLIAAITLNVSPFEFGLLGTIEFLPFILLSLPAGVWVDRLRRRPILIVGDVGRGLALVSIPIAFELHALTIWQLYVVGFINGCLTVFFDVAYQSYLPALVDRDDILEGNSKLEISRSAAQITGPGIAGQLIHYVGAPLAVILDSLSFFASAGLLLGIRREEPQPARRAAGEKRAGMRSEVAAGLRYVLRHPYLRNIAACTGISNLFSNMLFAVLLLYLIRTLGFTPETLGLALSLGAIGFLVGALVANPVGSRIGVGPTIVASAMVFAFSPLLFGVARGELAFPLSTVGLALGAFGGAVYNINQVSLRQAITPSSMQGRMNATMRFIVWGTIPIGSLLGGLLGGVIGLERTVWVGAIGGVFSFVPLLFSPVKSLMKMPAPVDDGSVARIDSQPIGAQANILGEAVDESARPVPGAGSPRPKLDD